ncbi:release factor glutamine methyltransferase [Leptolinea sp. HRD-7]|nr:release factor glutamine methyltransferase [Leptolinea sp. HRD-7]
MRPVSDSATLEAQLTASHALNMPRSWVIAHPEHTIPDEILREMNDIVNRLSEGYPFAYITGNRDFYGRTFYVRPGLLVPRPETELLVEAAISWLRLNPERRKAIDIGSGTGCIAVTLAAEVPDLLMTAVDIDPLAVEVTEQNARIYGTASRMRVRQGNLLIGDSEKYDLVCANLPYIPSATVDNLPAARHEPRLALDGGPDGLVLIIELLQQTQDRINQGGLILLEIEASQGERALQAAHRFFPQAKMTLTKDLAGLDRLISIQI